MSYVFLINSILKNKTDRLKASGGPYSYFCFYFVIKQYFYRIYPASVTVPHRTAPKRYFEKMPLHLNVTFLTHRNMQRYIEKYAVT